jgi:hypothetical protein
VTNVADRVERAGEAPGGPSREDVLQAISEAEQALLRTTLHVEERPVGDEAVTQLREHARYLDLIASEVGTDQSHDAYFTAGLIYEMLSSLPEIKRSDDWRYLLTSGQVGDLLRASLMYGTGDYEASSTLAARRVTRTLDDWGTTLDPLLSSAVGVLLRFLGREFALVFKAFRSYGTAVDALGSGEPSANRDWPLIGLLGRLCEACAVQSGAMVTGSAALFDQADKMFGEAVDHARQSSYRDIYALFERVAAVATAMRERSTYRRLSRSALTLPRVRWFNALVPELWSGQLDGLNRGVLETARSFVLAMPTGSGKSALAHMRIVATLDEYPQGWVAYVVPSRALVRQAYRDLKRALGPLGLGVRKIVAGAEASVLLETEEIPEVLTERTCVVMTPERLDLYLRVRPDLAASCRLIVVDEAHTLGEQGRGARLEALLSQFLSRWTDTKLLLVSAFMPNAEQLATWVGAPQSFYSTTRRSTRDVRGLCVRYACRDLPDQYVYKSGRRNVTTADRREGAAPLRRLAERRECRVGAVLSLRPGNLQASRVMTVPSLGHVLDWREIGPKGIRADSSGLLNAVTEVAATLARHPGLVIAFLPRTDWARNVCEGVAAHLPEVPALEQYAEAIRSVIGDHPLVNAIRHGCAYHHSRVPEEALRIVEAAAEAGLLEVLCATSGLQAGVNIPASIVLVVGDPQTKPGINPSYRNFSNMAGRAGRPRSDTEGIALYLPPSITYRNDTSASVRRYLEPLESDLTVESALSKALETLLLSDRTPTLDSLAPEVQQVLLGLYATDSAHVDGVVNFLAHTLAAQELNVEVLAEPLAAAIESARQAHPQSFGAFAKTALPYTVCLDLAEVADTLISKVEAGEWPATPAEACTYVASLLHSVDYFRQAADSVLGTTVEATTAATLVGAWVEGATYDDLASMLSGQLDRSFDLARTVAVISVIADLYAWGVGSLLAISRARNEIMGIVDQLLPYYVRFGVSRPVAAYLRLIGVSDRVRASVLAASFPVGDDVSLESVERWSRQAATRTVIRGLVADNAVSIRTIEADLGIEPDDTARVPAQSSVSGAPGWLLVGSFVSVAGDGLNTQMRETVGGRSAFAAREIAEGLYIAASREGDTVTIHNLSN